MSEKNDTQDTLEEVESEDLSYEEPTFEGYVEGGEVDEETNTSAPDLITVEASDKKPTSGKSSSNMTTKDGVIGAKAATASTKKTVTAKPKEATVALYSTRNVSWQGVGKVIIGYNIVTKAKAAHWLTRNHIREATPKEVAGAFGA